LYIAYRFPSLSIAIIPAVFAPNLFVRISKAFLDAVITSTPLHISSTALKARYVDIIYSPTPVETAAPHLFA